MTIYVETSALLSSLLGEPGGDLVKDAIDGVGGGQCDANFGGMVSHFG